MRYRIFRQSNRRYCRFAVVVCVLMSSVGCSLIEDAVISERPNPWDMQQNISPATRSLITKAFTFSDSETPRVIADYHLHVAANDPAMQQAYINPALLTWWHPLNKLRSLLIMDAMQVFTIERVNRQYQQRLFDILRHFQHARREYAPSGTAGTNHFYLYALDYYHDEQGKVNKERTDLYVSNDYVMKMAEDFNAAQDVADDGVNPTRIIPVASVHPYRDDFIQQVEQLSRRGIRFMKWLPPSMNIDLAAVPTEHYSALARYKMVLLTHTGKEHVLQTQRPHQAWGDPAKLQKALDCGVNVVALHSARIGKDKTTGVSYFHRLIRMMKEEKYRDRSYAEISMTTLAHNYFGGSGKEVLAELIHHSQVQGVLSQRLINGSDYPVPAISLLNPTGTLRRLDMISDDEKRQLDEIFTYNPILFDFVLKRTVKINAGGTAFRFPDAVFTSARFYQTPAMGDMADCQ